MSKIENLECPECWGTIPHPGDAHCISDARVVVLHKLALAMMVVELQNHFGTLDDALRVPAEAQRTYKRLLSSREAMKLLAQIEMSGLCLVSNP